MKKRLSILFVFLLLPLAASAAPGRGPGDILTNPRALARYLKLTPAQLETTKQLLQTLHNTTKPLHEQQKPLAEQLRNQLDAGADACAVGNTVLQLEVLRDRIRDARQDFDDAFSAILTPVQLAKWELLKDAIRGGEEEDE